MGDEAAEARKRLEAAGVDVDDFWERLLARLRAAGVSLRRRDSALCEYCGQPRGSGACQGSHP